MRFSPAPLIATVFGIQSAFGVGQAPFVSFEETNNGVVIARASAASPIYVDAADLRGVIRAAGDLQSDIERVSGMKPAVHSLEKPAGDHVIIIGTLGHSALIQQLVDSGKVDVSPIKDQWEAWLVQAVADPVPGVKNAVVIAGSDKRGTIFGIYELSEQIGVSPWFWWADVPVVQRDFVAIKPGTRVTDKPAVQYRGIFLNDEAPALSGWAHENFGGFNHKFYKHVFELILRLRGNFLWPAMWGSAFNDDDPLNPKVADEYGIVMSTSHHEPMQRAHAEWDDYGEGPWDYSRNEEVLRKFWTDGYNRTKQYENIVTLGMRGDGDEPMSEEENVALLEKIVADQREIIAKNDDRPLTEINQVWTLYKEVQGYYERGMRVPDDVTLLWSDDNWGNIRRLPTPEELNRSGGAGVYYHFDFVGGPRNYKWLNITPVSKIWEQMNLAWEYGAHKIWIVNVGDLKPMEFPIEFFLTLAWAPDRWPLERFEEFGVLWAGREFGAEHAVEIARMIAAYTKFNRRRSPELLSPDTYSILNYNEADNVVDEYNALAKEAGDLMLALPGEYRDAFFQLVYWPIKACAILNELYVAAAKNSLYALQGRAGTNAMAERVRELFAADAELTRVYHEELSGGKWNHFASQTHIGYTYWQQPIAQAMPAVTEVHVPDRADLGIAVEGQSLRGWRFGAYRGPSHALPQIDVYGDQTRTIDVFSRGSKPVSFAASTSQPWISVQPSGGNISDMEKLSVSVDWNKAPRGQSEAQIEITGSGSQRYTVKVPVFFPESPARDAIKGFVETDGHVSIEAEHFSRAVESDGITWNIIPDFGRTLSGVTPFPVTAESRTPAGDSPRLEYTMHLFSTGEVSVRMITAPTMNFVPGRGLRVGISFDDEEPQIVEIHANPDNVQDWELVTAESVRQTVTKHLIRQPGEHTLKVWMVDPGMVLQKIVVDLGGERPSYLGPPETFNTIASPADF